jgi:hypothetical protein
MKRTSLSLPQLAKALGIGVDQCETAYRSGAYPVQYRTEATGQPRFDLDQIDAYNAAAGQTAAQKRATS